MSTTTSDIKQEIDNLSASIQQLAPIFAREVDIHTHTREIGVFYQEFDKIDRKHNLSNTSQKLQDVIDEILTRCPAAQKSNVTKVLKTIQATTGADNETHANLQELLIRTWSLVNMPNNYSNAFDIFIQNLDHNIATGGGCVPGIAARLIQPYTHFVLRMLQVAHSEHVQQVKQAMAAAAQTKPVMPIAETKVRREIQQEMIDPLTGKALSPEQIRAQTAAFERFQPTEEQRAARIAARAAEEAKAEAEFQRVLRESAPKAQAGTPVPEQKPGTPVVEKEIKFTEEERRAQEELFARFKLTPEEIARREKATAEARLERETALAIKTSEALAAIEKAKADALAKTPAPVAAKPQAPAEHGAVRMVLSNQASALENKPQVSANSAPVAEKKPQTEADRVREARLRRFENGKK